MNYSTKSLILSQSNNISSNSNELNVSLPSVWYAQDSEVALSSLYIYFSWFNITTKFDNTQFNYTWTDGVSYPVILKNGYYSPSDITGFLQFTMTNNGHFLKDQDGNNVFYLSVVENAVYYADTIVSLPIPSGTLPVDWSYGTDAIQFGPLNGLVPQWEILDSNNFGNLIGFDAGSYPPAQQSESYSVNSQRVPKLSPVATISVLTNIANSGDFNQQQGIIHSFSPGNTPFGGLISVVPNYPVYFKINDGRVANINLTLLDDSNNPLEINDLQMIATLNIRILNK